MHELGDHHFDQTLVRQTRKVHGIRYFALLSVPGDLGHGTHTPHDARQPVARTEAVGPRQPIAPAREAGTEVSDRHGRAMHMSLLDGEAAFRR